MMLQIFNRYLYPGGEEKSVQRIFDEGSEVVPMTQCWFESTEWLGEGAPPKWRQARWLGSNPRSLERVREASRAVGAKGWLFHNLVPVASLGLYAEAGRLGVPVVQYVHNFRPFSPGTALWANGRVNDGALRGNYWPEIRSGSWQNSSLKTAILAWHMRRLRASGALDNVRAWIAISAFMAGKFVEAGIPADRVHVLKHSWNPLPERKESRDDGYYLFLGRLVQEKGVETLLAAWEILGRKMGAALPELVIAGDGPLRGKVEEAIEGNDKIRYVSFVEGDEKKDLIDRSRALIGPSIWWEPLGLVTYEAYDAGKPMIAAESGGLAETVVDGETGYLYPPGDAGALAAVVERMEAVSAEDRREMGRCGRRWLKENAEPEKWKSEFARIIGGVMNGG